MIHQGVTELRALILDSDPIVRMTLIQILSNESANWTIEECGNGLEAIPALRDFKPDIFICEVETPGIDGFALLETIHPKDRPGTIFLSKLDHFGARAFEVSAVDYILKPVRKERLLVALERALKQIETVKKPPPRFSEWNHKQIAIKSGRSVIFIKPEELDWADAEGKYVRLHIGKEVLFLKISITALEQELDPLQFVRIHRSTIVNVDRVRRIQPWNHRRNYQLTLQDGTRLVLSRKSKLPAVTGKILPSLSL
jgi:two-component system, LytTR family, response regulator